MTGYGKEDLLRLAKRDRNPRRTYLLVNPLQGKHMPVSPTRALEMMRELGRRMAALAGDIGVVIGFAETATAVAAGAAEGLGQPCNYIHTTREELAGDDVVEFREEHSHAVEQRLSLQRLRTWIDGASAVAFVDDELTTGRTLLSAVDRLTAACPSVMGKRIVAGSIINRLSDQDEAVMTRRGIRCASLLKLPPEDYTGAVEGFDIAGADAPRGQARFVSQVALRPSTEDARVGVCLGDWLGQLRKAAERLANSLAPHIDGKRVTVLGTEEYMLPGLILGQTLEARGAAERVRFHATTRSPIGICGAEGYPIRAGWRLRSFYEAGRPTFIYDLEPCDIALVMTDTPNGSAMIPAVSDLAGALDEVGCHEVILIREARHVQHL